MNAIAQSIAGAAILFAGIIVGLYGVACFTSGGSYLDWGYWLMMVGGGVAAIGLLALLRVLIARPKSGASLAKDASE